MNPNDIVEIIPRLFISNWDTSNNPVVLQNNNIKAVITLETIQKSADTLAYYDANNIDHIYIYIGDHPMENISQYFDRTYDFINRHISRGDNVLVHCMAGVSRSASIILNYIIRKTYENNQAKTCPCNVFKDVLEYARSRRPILNPNPGFQKALLLKTLEYQQECEKKLLYNRKQYSTNMY